MGFLAGKGWVLAVPAFIAAMILLLSLKRLYDRAGASSRHGKTGRLLARFRVMTDGIFKTLRIGDNDLEGLPPPALHTRSRPGQEIDTPRRPIEIFRGPEGAGTLPPPLYNMNLGPGEETLVNAGLPAYESVVPPPPAYFATRTAREIDQLVAVRSLYWHD